MGIFFDFDQSRDALIILFSAEYGVPHLLRIVLEWWNKNFTILPSPHIKLECVALCGIGRIEGLRRHHT